MLCPCGASGPRAADAVRAANMPEIRQCLSLTRRLSVGCLGNLWLALIRVYVYLLIACLDAHSKCSTNQPSVRLYLLFFNFFASSYGRFSYR